MGRFISEDPIGFGGEDTNLFRYSYNNPVNSRDPLGLLIEQMTGGGDHGEGPGYDLHNEIQNNPELSSIDEFDFPNPSGLCRNGIKFGIKKGLKKGIKKNSKKSGKEKASDVPSFAKGKGRNNGESSSEAAERILRENGQPIIKGPRSNFSKIKKHIERTGK